MKEEIGMLEERVQRLETETRKNNLILRGIPENERVMWN